VHGFAIRFQRYPRDYHDRRIKPEHFDVCPLAGGASRAAYARAAIGDLQADDFVLIFSNAIAEGENAPVISSFFGSVTPNDLAQDDAPVFWLGAAQPVNLDLWRVGESETPMREFHWQILHHDPPGRFQIKDTDALNAEIEEAVEKIYKHEKTSTQRTGEPQEKPAEAGFLRRLIGLLHSDRKANHG
jgi:hypothetical protein